MNETVDGTSNVPASYGAPLGAFHKMNRLSSLGAAPALVTIPTATFASKMTALTAQPASVRIAPPEYPETKIWAFDGLSPGPEIRVSQGSRVERRFLNKLDVPSSIHWHGIRLDNAMDGVPGVTQAAVEPGESFDYAFACPDAGTFWYHSHMKAVEQVERGLYGVLIVEEPDAPDIDGEHVLVLDDWRLNDQAQISDDFGNGHDLSHGGRIGNVVTTNGSTDRVLAANQGDRLRLRLVNAANARIFTLGLRGMRGWVVATDGMPVEPREAGQPIDLAPAQRIDLIVAIQANPGEDAVLLDFVRGEDYAQASFRVTKSGPGREAAPVPLPPNPLSTVPDPAGAREIAVRMEGGAMRWLSEADSGHGRKSGRELAGEGLFWALNGYAGRPEEPLAKVGRGEAVLLTFINDTMWPHAMHLHGHHFFELDPSGRPGDFRDTTLVQPGDSRKVLFAAHNPGDWLLHCHMLGHHASGMGTWLRVT